MFERICWEFIIEALTPIAHASETIGNTSLAMRRKVRQPDGTFCDVPIITGDTMRHGLREAGAYAALDATGLLDSPSLSEAALRLLFAGGTLSGKVGAVKIDAYRDMVDTFPVLSLLGGCAQNRPIAGKIEVCNADLICLETAHILPEWVTDWLREKGVALQSCRSHIEEVQRVRMDPSLDPGKRKLLSDGGASVEQRLLASEHGKEVGDVVLAEDNKSTMLPRRYETVVGGSLFLWSVSATVHSEIERDTFATIVGAFLRDARVGGKRGTGHGRIRPVIAKQIKVQRPREAPENLDTGALGPSIGSLFYAHMKERSDRFRKFLAEVDA